MYGRLPILSGDGCNWESTFSVLDHLTPNMSVCGNVGKFYSKTVLHFCGLQEFVSASDSWAVLYLAQSRRLRPGISMLGMWLYHSVIKRWKAKARTILVNGGLWGRVYLRVARLWYVGNSSFWIWRAGACSHLMMTKSQFKPMKT